MIPSLLRSPLHAGHWTETCTDPVVNLCTCVFLTSAPLLEGAQICPFPLKSSNSPKFLFKLKWVFPTFPGSWLDLIVQVSSEADKPCNDSRHLHTAEGHTGYKTWPPHNLVAAKTPRQKTLGVPVVPPTPELSCCRTGRSGFTSSVDRQQVGSESL